MSFQAITLVIAFAKVLFEWHTFVILMAKVSFKTLKCHFQNRHYYFLRIWHSIQVQASELRFLQRIEGVTLFNKVRSSEIPKSLNIEPLLLRIERSQLRWFGHVSRMPGERLPKQALLAKADERRPVGRPRTRWTDYIEDLGWNRLGLHPSETLDVMEDRELWRLNFELVPPRLSRKSGQ